MAYLTILEEEHVATDIKEFKEELTELHKKLVKDLVSSVHLILRTKEGSQQWGIWLVKMYIIIAQIVFPFQKQQE